MKIAPNGSKLAICNSLINAQLFDFDVSTGMVSNPLTLHNTNGAYGVEFSPNNEVLYVSVSNPSPYKIIQYNLNASDIIGSAYIHSQSDIFPGALQTGPDGKIYIAEIFQTKLGVINNPNTIGAGCSVQYDAIDLAGKVCDLGLPTFITSYFYTPAIQLNNTCEGEAVNFSFSTNQTILSATWNFGDGNTSNAVRENSIT